MKLTITNSVFKEILATFFPLMLLVIGVLGVRPCDSLVAARLRQFGFDFCVIDFHTLDLRTQTDE
jgi:hypothetical protein